ncbi:DUF4232 domain-containing protein [Streptomyces smyrnaeus]|uniref:DUF4232 domain-containing protein n=1 Tax=Streptomyces smyrnaeus TaxID=1387713 RepID=UPI0027DE8DFB|nr:DUF4232 domain-containing protein [Streptomyces smyrnaeus]
MTTVREQQQHAARTSGRAEPAASGRRRVDGSARLAAVAAVGAAAVLLTGCGSEGSGSSAPKKVAGEAAPAPADSPKDSSKKRSASPSSSSDPRGGGAKDDDAPPASSDDKNEGSAGTTGGGSGGGAADSGFCKTPGLAMSTSSGMAEGTLLVNLRNTSSATCTLRGFPGVDLKSNAGSFNAARNNTAPPTVTLQPGQTTRFTLHYPRNDTGGSGVTVTSLVVTPPNETQSQTLPTSINLPVSDSPTPPVTVGPVGAGK